MVENAGEGDQTLLYRIIIDRVTRIIDKLNDIRISINRILLTFAWGFGTIHDRQPVSGEIH